MSLLVLAVFQAPHTIYINKPGCFPSSTPLTADSIPLQSAYREELLRLTQVGILVQIHDEYTPWVNSTVVTRKPNDTIRLCLDSVSLIEPSGAPLTM